MEQIFPLLIGLAIFAYKIYENFNKQKEEDRKRNLKRPAQMQQAAPPPVQKAKSYTPPPPPVFKQPEQHLVQKRIQTDTKLSDEMPAEVTRVRNERERVKRLKLEPVALENGEEVNFDLRRAIIQQAILERPYKY